MSWKKIVKIINDLEKNLENFDNALLIWEKLKIEINSADHEVPYHIIQIINLLKNNKHYNVLDHGCGNGKTIIYLLANGYLNVKGVDISFNGLKYNKFFIKILTLSQPIFFNYNGDKLPFEDTYFDFIFSQQVLEHVDEENINNYFTEENRVLKRGGMVYHQIPHLLVPYESHVKIWFVHWFPDYLRNFIFKFYKIDTQYFSKNIFLRKPNFFITKFNSNFGSTINISKNRFLSDINLTYYDGNIYIRKILQYLFKLPFLGKIFLYMLIKFTMLEIVSIKSINFENLNK